MLWAWKYTHEEERLTAKKKSWNPCNNTNCLIFVVVVLVRWHSPLLLAPEMSRQKQTIFAEGKKFISFAPFLAVSTINHISSPSFPMKNNFSFSFFPPSASSVASSLCVDCKYGERMKNVVKLIIDTQCICRILCVRGESTRRRNRSQERKKAELVDKQERREGTKAMFSRYRERRWCGTFYRFTEFTICTHICDLLLSTWHNRR